MDACMHKQIDSNDLVYWSNAEALDALHHFEEEDAERYHPNSHCKSSNQLNLQLFKAAGIYQASVTIENADCETSPETTEAMHLGCLDRVVNLCLVHEIR